MSAIICRRISILRNESNLLASNFTQQIKNTHTRNGKKKKKNFPTGVCNMKLRREKKHSRTPNSGNISENFSQCRTFDVATGKLVGNNLILREYCAFNGNANDTTSTTTCRPTHNTPLQSSIHFQLLFSQRIYHGRGATWSSHTSDTSHTNLNMHEKRKEANEK